MENVKSRMRDNVKLMAILGVYIKPRPMAVRYRAKKNGEKNQPVAEISERTNSVARRTVSAGRFIGRNQ